MTRGELLSYGRSRLFEAGIEDHKTDASILMEYLTGLERSDLMLRRDDEISVREREEYDALIARRLRHEPVQYITGEADFMGLKFRVSPDVLIPRFDTEFLTEELLREVSDGSSVLDMCTGSGCILLSLMRYKNGIRGTGADISEAALAIARENESVLEDKMGGHIPVSWVRSDMFKNITGTFDHIVSNPPYIRTEEIKTLMPEVRDHEPFGALDGDQDGLKFYRLIAKESGTFLKKHGRLFLEIGYDEAEAVSGLLHDNSFTDIEVIKDYSGNDRVVKATVKRAEHV